ncbi:hypothetical protein KKH82_08785 [Patescibacteria group bacterium]|nr:hypothetical protein [Patescibacteria group bacterium]
MVRTITPTDGNERIDADKAIADRAREEENKKIYEANNNPVNQNSDNTQQDIAENVIEEKEETIENKEVKKENVTEEKDTKSETDPFIEPAIENKEVSVVEEPKKEDLSAKTNTTENEVSF